MNARLEPDPRAAAEIDRFRRIRSRMTDLAQGLSAEDLAAQSMPDCRLRTHSQNKTVAARAMAERKTVGQRS